MRKNAQNRDMYADTEAMSSSDFPICDFQKAQQYTDRVQSRLTKENIMISIGVELTFAGGEETIDEYLSLADQNMYCQKQMRKESRKNID